MYQKKKIKTSYNLELRKELTPVDDFFIFWWCFKLSFSDVGDGVISDASDSPPDGRNTLGGNGIEKSLNFGTELVCSPKVNMSESTLCS